MIPLNKDAYVVLLDHAAACPGCRTTPFLCPEGQRFADALRTVQTQEGYDAAPG
ncbi:hypothetical protein U9R90_14595 [Streptomyces sp. E11-3]|uniref:hypothetical protein n=1 Tax=Streptomyces sp. E11-3 TaxID=3110112 RepID=UPI0039813F01